MQRDPAEGLKIIAGAQAKRPVIQDFRPLAESLEWRLGQGYLRERGNKAFISDAAPVPFVVNNDGNLSARAAEVFFASLVAAEHAGGLEPDVFVLELGIGVGLFARFFLDQFRRLCDDHEKDFYERLRYIAGDYSEKMLLDACRRGIFADHAGRYALRVVDALDPERSLVRDPLFGGLADRPFRAVFLNYLLDCLPATVLQVEGELRQLCVRTCLARGVDLRDYTSASVEELVHLAASPHPEDERPLMEVFDLFALEYAYLPADPSAVPHGDFAAEFGRSAGTRSLLHNFGAIQSLECLLGLLHEQGFILINDYGTTQVDDVDDFQHQRFSNSTFIGLNFPLLKAYFAGADPGRWVEPPEGEDASVHARLLGHRVAPETVACFQERFSKEDRDWRQGPVNQAWECIKTGRYEAALEAYQRAMERQPPNWVLMNEVARFLETSLRAPAAGLEMARAALALNPTCSPELWNTLGDCLFDLGRIAEAEQAYLRALQINAEDVRARFNLAYVYARTRQYALGLQRIAEALALDTTAECRDGLLQKQSELLTLLAERNQRQYRRKADRISTPTEPAVLRRDKIGTAGASPVKPGLGPNGPAVDALSIGPGAGRRETSVENRP